MDLNETNINLHEEDLQRLRGFRLLDDDFMSIVFDSNIEGTELLLRIILDRSDLVVTEVVGQREIKNASGRSVRLDIHAQDSTGKHYDIEIQREDKGAGAQRARFNSSMLDTKLLKPGQKWKELADTYVIFITENDVMKAGLPLYHIDRWVRETRTLFGDGAHIIYVNGAYKNEEDAVGQLMHDFRCVSADDMHYEVLADRVRYFKETEGGQEVMCRVMEEMRDQAEHNKGVKMALKLISRGKDSYEEIAELTELSVEEIKELSCTMSA